MDVKRAERFLKTLANKRRLEIVLILRGKRVATVGELASDIKMPIKTTSKHLAILLAAGIVEREQVGPTAEYYLIEPLHLYTKTILSNLTSR